MANVIIIGAGPSGLTAACSLVQKGHTVTILEKQSEVGGRVKTVKFHGQDVDTGPSWIHNSEHPVARLFNNTGRYEEFFRKNKQGYSLEEFKKEKKQTLKFQDHFFNIILSTDNSDLAMSEIYQLSWNGLIDELFNEQPGEHSYLGQLRDLFSMLTEDEIVLDYASPIHKEIFKQKLASMLDVDMEMDSIVAGQNYVGLGDENFLPEDNISKVTEHLLSKSMQLGVTIRTNVEVSHVSKNQVTYSRDGFPITESADKVVVAIAPNDYDKLNIELANEQSIAVKNFRPSGRAKIILKLNQTCEQVSSQSVEVDGNSLYITIKKKGDIAYILVPAEKVSENAEAFIDAVVEPALKSALNNNSLKVDAYKTYHADGNSWFSLKKGSCPVKNNMDDDSIVFLGVATGCDDAIHSVVTRAAIETGQADPDLFLENLFKASPAKSNKLM